MPSFSLLDLAGQLSDPSLLVTDLTNFEKYFHDATIATGRPSAIVFAAEESDVIATLRFCKQNNLAVVPRGAGTGLSGGCVPKDGSLVLSTERMTGLHIDAEARTARVGPGVITKHLMDAAAEFGLTYPPDPASYDESTIGGNVAENAGGLRCKRFGVTKDYVIGIRAITADGGILKTGIYNDNRGFALGDVIIGSEGTLAVITEIAVRLIPTPAVGDTILVAFDSPKDAAQTVSDITRAGIVLTVMEYLDGDAAACSNQYEHTEGIDNAAAILLLETPAEERTATTRSIRAFCEKNRSSYLRVESHIARAESLWRVRRNLSKAVQEIAETRISEDVAVPISKFPVLVDFVADMNRRSPLRINAFGHAGDGNLHVNFLSMSGDSEDYAVMEREIEVLLTRAVELGGTLSGEHGIGLAKQDYLKLEFDDVTLDYMKRIKSVFDVDGLLNPGKIFV